MRRHFELPESDEVHLGALGLPWETVIEAGNRWLLIHDRVLPAGYSIRTVSEAHRIDPGYPDTQLDMVYFYPAVARLDGKTIAAVSPQSFDGKEWQRWSRHRSSQNPWQPGVDDLAGHLLLVQEWLEREIRK
jgi:hypothetical protein